MSWNLSDAWNTIRNVPHKAKSIASEVASEAGDVKDGVATAFEDTLKLGRYVKDHPPSLNRMEKTLGAIADTVRTGETATVEAKLPPYVAPPAAELEAARKRGEGRTVSQPYIASDSDGQNLHEPVTMVVTGSLDDLEKALKSQGWWKAPSLGLKVNVSMAAKFLFGTEKNVNGPVSRMWVNGHEAVAAFNKNDDYNAGRDHLRIFNAGTDPKTGQTRWEIAATRDVASTITVPHPTMDGWKPHFEAPHTGHRTDPAIDHERDLIMHDLLASGTVKDWASVQGKREGQDEKALPDGKVQIGNRITDGHVYEVQL